MPYTNKAGAQPILRHSIKPNPRQPFLLHFIKPNPRTPRPFQTREREREREMMERPHAVCIPYPAQGHVTPLLKLAKLLHHLRGFYITFVNTEFNHQRLLRSRGPDSLKGLDDFRFETIPDGLPPSDREAAQDIPALCDSTSNNCLAPFRNLLTKLNTTPNTPQVTCIISDGIMTFTLDAAEEFRIPEVLFWTPSACGVMCCLHHPQLIERGLTPLKG